MTEKTVLVVDDQKMFRDAVAFEMDSMGFHVDVAEDGEQGLKKATATPYSIILSDIRMPNWDGGRFLSELRKIAPDSPPFIFMTGFADLTPQDAFDMGADGFLGKPLNPDQLVEIVERLIKPPAEQMMSAIGEIKGTIAANHSHLTFGRRGVFVGGSIDMRFAKVGSLVSLELDIGSLFPLPGDFKGVGRVRWVRSIDDEGLSRGVGIEFVHIKDPYLSAFLKYISEKKPLATIPKGSRSDLSSANVAE